jgi:hypothetical protein
MPARFHALITNFTFGETSPRVGSRVGGDNLFGMSAGDVYRSGCREVTNMLILPQGGAYKREGLKFGRDTADDVVADGAYYRLFMLRDELADIVLLCVPGQAWLYTLMDFQVIGHVVTPYAQSELADLGVAQYEEKVVIYSAGHRPRQLTFEPNVSFIDPGAKFIPPLYAYRDERSPISQTAEWSLVVTFAPNPAGGATLNHAKACLSVSGVHAADSFGTPITTDFVLDDPGTTITGIGATLNTYMRSVVPGSASADHVSTAGAIVTYTIRFKYNSSKGDGTGTLAFWPGLTPVNLIGYDFTNLNFVVGDAEPLWSGPFLLLHGGSYWECIASHIAAATNEPGVGVDSDAYWTNRGATVPTDKDYDVEATKLWAIDNSYSPRGRGWPGVMAFHEQRLVGNGPQGAQAAIAAAKLSGGGNDIFDFTLGVNDNDGLLFKLASIDNAIVRWFQSAQKLFIGTSGGVFVQLAQPWTPTNVAFERINGYNSSVHLHSVEVDGDLFFPTVDDRQIRQVQFINDLQQWQSWELLSFADHLFTDKRRIKQLASHQSVETYLWAVRNDGALMGMTYGMSQSAYHSLAWHKHAVSDPVIEVGTGFNGSRYVMVALVNRLTYQNETGTFVRHPMLETMEHTSQNLFDVEPEFFGDNPDLDVPLDWSVQLYSGTDWSVHLDSYVTLVGNGDTQLSVPVRFAGRAVQVMENGVYLGQFIPDYAGRIVVETLVDSDVHVGFGYVSRIEPNRLESQSAMTSQSERIRWVLPMMRLVSSAMPKLNGTRPNERTQDDFYDTATGLFTGDVKIANFGSSGRIVIEQDLPLPLHLTGIFGLMTTEEG